jgi:hypothetical protein
VECGGRLLRLVVTYELAIYHHLNDGTGKGRQLAAMWMATIARTAPAVNVVAAINSIARCA